MALAAVAAALATYGGATAEDIGHDAARRLRETGAILPAERLIERALARWPGRVIELELERDDGRYVYEIELLDAQGNVRELEFDAASGRLLKQELDD